jgi:hypothetical protein
MLLQHMICNRFGHLVTLTCESGLSEGAVKDNIDFQVTIISSIPDRGVYSGRTLFGVVHCPLVIPGLLTAIGVQQGNPVPPVCYGNTVGSRTDLCNGIKGGAVLIALVVPVMPSHCR